MIVCPDPISIAAVLGLSRRGLETTERAARAERRPTFGMTQTFSLLGFVAHLKAVEHDMNALGPAIVAKACEMVAEEARRVIGVGYDFWPALQPATLARKMM